MSGRFKRIKRSAAIWMVNHLFCGTHFWKIKSRLLNTGDGNCCALNAKVVGPIYIGSVAKLSIGENTWVGRGLKVYGNGSVTIGANCDIAPEVAFVTGSHEQNPTVGFERRAGKGISFSMIVEDGSWLGARSTLMGNIVIGRKSIVGACALVNKDVEANTIVAGVPAKKLRKIEN